jgi:cbb3-type cytochrome oxidase subunit 3
MIKQALMPYANPAVGQVLLAMVTVFFVALAARLLRPSNQKIFREAEQLPLDE